MNFKAAKTIFIVEDSRDIRDLLQILYEAEGYSVKFAVDGQDALAKLKAEVELPGVILLDLMMPGMNGSQFRSEQMKDPRLAAVPVLVMSADSLVQAKAHELGADGYLKKPIDLDILLKVAQKYCG